MKNLANEIVEWLKNYANKNNRKAFVVGVSGGVDSALVSTLCAMTGIKTVCVILPCQSKPTDAERAEKHIEWLMNKFQHPTINKVQLDLTKTFEALRHSFCGFYPSELAYANDKSRLRMIALYHLATCFNGLVVGTGNKVEDFGVYFFTKYGDGGVDISPIADLMKSEVRQMCRELGILSDLSEAVSDDGLWADARTDEQAIGASYDELEWAMNYLETTFPEYESPLELTPRQKEVLATYEKWHTAGAHKLAPIPTFKRKKLG